MKKNCNIHGEIPCKCATSFEIPKPKVGRKAKMEDKFRDMKVFKETGDVFYVPFTGEDPIGKQGNRIRNLAHNFASRNPGYKFVTRSVYEQDKPVGINIYRVK